MSTTLIVLLMFFPVAVIVTAIAGICASSISCKTGGQKHSWYSPAFRVRSCCFCGRREVLIREWEFDGYEVRP